MKHHITKRRDNENTLNTPATRAAAVSFSPPHDGAFVHFLCAMGSTISSSFGFNSHGFTNPLPSFRNLSSCAIALFRTFSSSAYLITDETRAVRGSVVVELGGAGLGWRHFNPARARRVLGIRHATAPPSWSRRGANVCLSKLDSLSSSLGQFARGSGRSRR